MLVKIAKKRIKSNTKVYKLDEKADLPDDVAAKWVLAGWAEPIEVVEPPKTTKKKGGAVEL